METINQKTVKTRKTHPCSGCLRKFPSGTTMELSTSVDGSDIFSSYWCDVCAKVMSSWHADDLQEIEEGGVLDHNPEFWYETADSKDGGE